MSVHIIYYKDGAKMMRPVLSRPEYLALRNSGEQIFNVAAIREGDTSLKQRLLQMNYSCLPNEDGTLKGSKTMSTTVGMDIDHLAKEEMQAVRERILQKKAELGLLMLELSARGEGYHLVFRRRPELSQEENLRWASEVLGVAFDQGAKDITRVFFTTTASAEDLLFLDDEVFEQGEQTRPLSDIPSSAEEVCLGRSGRLTFSPLGSERRLTLQESPDSSLPLLGGEKPRSNSAQGAEGGHLQERETAQEQGTSQIHSAPSLAGRAGGESGLPSFKGIPYSLIIQEYWRRTGGEPVEGERNVKLYQLAVNLRAICDNRRALLMQVMPRLGLSEAEVQGIVDSACKESPKGISKLVQGIVENVKCKMNDEKCGEESDDEWSGDGVSASKASDSSQPLTVNPRRLPIGLKESLVGVPAGMQMPVLCAVLPIAAACADGVEVEYCDGQRQRLGLMSIIRGEQASGKSVCKGAVDVWKRQFDEEDALARRREEEWKERKKARKANEKAPEDPHVLIRVLPVTVSCSTLLKRFKNAAGHTLYSFGEELDTLRKTNGAGSWSSKYDIYRLGFDHGEWGQDYNSDQAESGVVRVAYNWTMLGTDGAMRKCFKQDNIENGLSSRILVAEMPDASFSKMPKFGRRTAEDEARIQEAVTRLRSYTGFIDTPRLRRAIEAWVEQKRVEAAKDIDRVKDTYRKRAAVIGFRCGVIFLLLAQENEKLKEKDEKCREPKAAIDFALMMAEYCLEQQIRAFGEALQKEYVDARDESQRYGANHSVFDQLPPVFTVNELAALKPNSLSRNSINKIISRWHKDGWIEREDKTHWRKVKVS